MSTDKQVLRSLGERIKQARLNQDMAQEELADRSGIGLRTINRIEKGEENYNVLSLIAIARALGKTEQIEGLFPKVINPLLATQHKPQKQRARAKEHSSETNGSSLNKPGFTWGDE